MCANQQAAAPSASMISRTPATDALDRPHKRRRSTGSFDSNSTCRSAATSNGSSTASSSAFLAGAASAAAASASASSTFDLAAVFATICDAEEAFPSIGWIDDDDNDDEDCTPLPEATTPLMMMSNKRELSGLQRTKACRSLPALPTFR